MNAKPASRGPKHIPTTLPFHADVVERMIEVTEKFKVSRAKLFESLLLLSDEQIGAQLEATAEVQAARKKARLASRQTLQQRMSRLTPEQIAAIEAMTSDSE